MKILICDDHAIFRAGLRLSLTDAGYQLVEAGGSAEALDAIEADSAIELVLLDLRMPGVDGWQTLRQLRERHPAIPVVIVSASEDPQEVRGALESGAAGFIPKSSSPELVRSALQVVFSGGVYVPPEALANLGRGLAEVAGRSATSSRERSQRANDLTPRQLEVLRLMARGLTNKEIGDALGIASATVKTHIAAVLDILDVTNRTEATMVMRELGLDEDD